MCEKEYKMRQKKHRKYHMGLVTRQGADNSLSGVPDTTFSQHYPVPPEEVPEQFRSEVTVYHNSIYIAGKFAIEISAAVRDETSQWNAYYFRMRSYLTKVHVTLISCTCRTL